MTSTQIRRGHAGQPGNPGEFARAPRSESTIALTQPDQVADHTDIDRYFDGGVDDILTAPWVGDSVSPSYYEGDWRRRPIVEVDPRGLKRTQKRIFKKNLVRIAAGGPSDGGDVPWIVKYRGADYVIDGHHRVANAVHNGHQAIPVHIVDLDA